jgi:hypothetical protein
MSSITDFKAAVVRNKGLSKANRFKVIFTNIPGWDGGTNGLGDLTVFCSSVSMPGKTIETLDYSLYRNKYKVPIGYMHDDVTITFNLSSNYLAKDALDKWQNYVIDENDYLLKYDAEYKKDINIYQLDESNKTVYSVKLINAYPVTVQAVDLSDDSSDTISTVSAVFSFDKIEITKNN